jgi:hypothetical protein
VDEEVEEGAGFDVGCIMKKPFELNQSLET